MKTFKSSQQVNNSMSEIHEGHCEWKKTDKMFCLICGDNQSKIFLRIQSENCQINLCYYCCNVIKDKTDSQRVYYEFMKGDKK